MPYFIDWYIEDRVIYLQEFGELTVDDLFEINHTLRAMLKDYGDTDYPLHLVIDHTALLGRPVDMGALRGLMDVFSNPALGWSVVVGTNPVFWRFLYEMVNQFTDANLGRIDAMEAVADFLRDIDSSL